MDSLPFYLGGFGIVILSLVGLVWLQNELLIKKTIEQTVEALNTGATVEQVLLQFQEKDISSENGIKLVELAQIRRHRHNAIEQLEEGHTEEKVISTLTAQGISVEAAKETVADVQFSQFCRKRPVLCMTLGICLPLLGIALMVAGVVLFYGNYSGLFVTFKHAGRITLGIGLISLWGGWKILKKTLRS